MVGKSWSAVVLATKFIWWISRRKKRNFKSNSNNIKDLDRKVLQVFNQNSNKILNYKQIASKLDINDSNGRNQIIKKVYELKKNYFYSEFFTHFLTFF